MLASIDRLQRKVDAQPKAFDALDEHVKTALSMITAPETKRAFDLASEDPRLRDRYGRTTVGQRLLLARRLIESGVRFVTVTSPSWDTHAGNFESLKKNLVPPIDMGLPALLQDLEEHACWTARWWSGCPISAGPPRSIRQAVATTGRPRVSP